MNLPGRSAATLSALERVVTDCQAFLFPHMGHEGVVQGIINLPPTAARSPPFKGGLTFSRFAAGRSGSPRELTEGVRGGMKNGGQGPPDGNWGIFLSLYVTMTFLPQKAMPYFHILVMPALVMAVS